jgi:hypothetical protein
MTHIQNIGCLDQAADLGPHHTRINPVSQPFVQLNRYLTVDHLQYQVGVMVMLPKAGDPKQASLDVVDDKEAGATAAKH